MKGKLITVFIFAFCGLVLFLSIRGLPGNPTTTDLLQKSWRDNGPFELSPERGRFALTYSLVETHSVFFPVDIARFVIPDLGYSNGHYVSLFAPLLSFVVVPGYMIGKMFNLAQVGTFAVISLLALFNTFLIYKLSIKIGANKYAALLGALIFLFATPAYAYAVSLYQHHLTAFLMLISLYLYMSYENALSSFAIFFLFALGLPLDYPNFFMMSPIALFTAWRMLGLSREDERKLVLRVHIPQVLSVLGVVLPFLFFFWFNTVSYGGPLHTLGGSFVTSVKGIDSRGVPIKPPSVNIVEKLQSSASQESSSLLSNFQTRNLLNGFYIHFTSPDRGILYFTPIIFFAAFGLFILYKNKNKYFPILCLITGINIILYSLWGDPWGGWAFGSRYLIPTYTLMTIFISIAITYYGKKWWFVIPFLLILFYSIGVNTLGALTSSANPPQVQVLQLEKQSGRQERYSIDRNWQFLNSGQSKSYFFQTIADKYMNAKTYYFSIVGLIAFITFIAYSVFFLKKNEK